jgi:hypothetical protein
MGSNVIVARTPQPCSASGAKSDYSQTVGGSIGTAGQAIHQPWPAARFLLTGRAKTTSVIDTITRRAKHEAGLPVLILKIPNNPILQSCALPDYNCGATLVRPEMCVHVFSSSISHFCGADRDAPV